MQEIHRLLGFLDHLYLLNKPLYIIMYLDMYKDRIQNSSFFYATSFFLEFRSIKLSCYLIHSFPATAVNQEIF